MARRNTLLPYDPSLRKLARELRKNATLGEVLLWKALRAKQLKCEFHRQVPIDRYIVDFYCHERRLAIEVDGSSHNDDEVFAHDVQRQRALEQLGVTVLRFLERDVQQNLPQVLTAIAGFLGEDAS